MIKRKKRKQIFLNLHQLKGYFAWVILPRARHSLIINYNQSIILPKKRINTSFFKEIILASFLLLMKEQD